jgi:hypothetical protein
MSSLLIIQLSQISGIILPLSIIINIYEYLWILFKFNYIKLLLLITRIFFITFINQ